MLKLLGSKTNPKGPNFNRAKKHVYEFSGTKLTFLSPLHTMPGYSGKFGRKKSNLFNDNEFSISTRTIKASSVLKNHYSETWAYNGIPIIEGIIGDLTLSTSVIASGIEESIFNKEAFEGKILQSIDDNYGPFCCENAHNMGNKYKAPLNWGSDTFNDTEWLHYDMDEKRGFDGQRIYTTPLTDRHYLRLNFIISEQYKENYCRPLMYELMQQILSSVKLELSPESLKQKEEAEALYPNQKYSDFKPMFEWPEFETMKPPETIFDQVKRENKERMDELRSFKA